MKTLNDYRKDGIMSLKHMWIVVLIFTLGQVIVAIYTAHKNSIVPLGYKSASFAAIWSMFLTILLTIHGRKVAYAGEASPLSVGFLIGMSAMLCQLYFVLMCVFFVLAAEANHLKLDTAEADNAFGAFSFLNMIIYFVWTIILVVHRSSIISEKMYREPGTPTANPMSLEAGDESYENDDERVL